MIRRDMRATLLCALVLIAVDAAVAADNPLPRPFPTGFRDQTAQRKEYQLATATLRVFARGFAQGDVAYLELCPHDSSAFPSRPPTLHAQDYHVPLSRKAWGYRGFFALSPDDDPGTRVLSVEYPRTDTLHSYRFELPVAAAAFEVSHATMNVGRFSDVNHAKSPETQRFIAACAAKKERAFAHRGEDLITSARAHPRDQHAITSAFWSSRVYERYQVVDGKRVTLEPSRKVHRGLDLRGTRGEPVFAMAGGEVVLAEKTYYEGNFVVLDHGNRVMSYYMHLDSLCVATGLRVAAGTQIGTVGATGVSTAPHLHVSLTIDRVQVDPMSFLVLPIRD
jgi:murein DD-endopeptidase